MQYGYAVILDGDCGDFLAHVTDSDGEVVYDVNGFDLVGQKFSGNANDMADLKALLIEKKIIGDNDDIVALSVSESKDNHNHTDDCDDNFSPS